MASNNLFVIFGIATLVMQLTNAASITAPSNSCKCTREYMPICGSDDVTYSNKCLFECAKQQKGNLEIKSRGECNIEFNLLFKEDCPCTFIYEPVCGSDGNTYSSQCQFNCAKKFNRHLEVFSKGECVQVKNLPIEKVEKLDEATACVCTREYRPVCGSDDHTYSNECMFNCARKTDRSLKIKSRSKCDAIEHLAANKNHLCVCTMEYSPVCGSDGNTYSSKCLMECEKRHRTDLKVKHVGEC